MPLSIPTSCQQRGRAKNCQAEIIFYYNDQTYVVKFSRSPVSHYYRSLHIIPSSVLSYTAEYSCSDNDNCAIDFASKKVLDLSNRTYNIGSVTYQLSNLLLEHRPPSDPELRCYNNEECVKGVCQTLYNIRTSTMSGNGCLKNTTAQVLVLDGSFDPSLTIVCNRTRCNSPETYNKVKEILFRHNLTDINGQLNGGQKSCVSVFLLIVMFNSFVFLCNGFFF
ncbi:unnamed protein product [Adineta steineri]|uniref:Uncharacterized protein n=1 Tax=Adineta steineri TaxID=433720 RepID=A0A814V1I5_9BILA|nr:unnamed protein product [Adineta steineri]CAF3693401.1 unnamed protein product [Adineta steineri]